MQVEFEGTIFYEQPFTVKIDKTNIKMPLYAYLNGKECLRKEGDRVKVYGTVDNLSFCVSTNDNDYNEVVLQLMECEVEYES